MTTTRICEVIKTLDAGGAEVLLVERLRRERRAGLEYTVVFMQAATDELCDALRSAGVRVVDLRGCPRWRRYARLIGVVRGLAPDVINVHSPSPATALRPFVRLMRPRPLLISTVHQEYYGSLAMLLNRPTRRFDDLVVAVSPQVAVSRSARGARRIRTRIHGIDVGRQRYWADHADEVRKEFGIPEDAFVLAFVANMKPAKNHLLLIDAASRVLARRPDALFVLAGDGPLRARVLAEVDRRGLTDRVRFLGRVPHANRLVAAADALLLCSDSEGMPVVVMEAIAAGVPVVSTAVGGVPELIDDNRNGILTPAGSAEAFAEGVLRAMRPEVHRVLAAGARADAAKVDVSETADWFDELYATMSAEARRG
ncbi:glycosyltransferase [Streptomyces sp. NPDC050263]|uniref:glycosyltransferase n=1 Tax=Streptomyces sp. NPDC050263 TaxID=3155037 RepID=UPI00342D6D0B